MMLNSSVSLLAVAIVPCTVCHGTHKYNDCYESTLRWSGAVRLHAKSVDSKRRLAAYTLHRNWQWQQLRQHPHHLLKPLGQSRFAHAAKGNCLTCIHPCVQHTSTPKGTLPGRHAAAHLPQLSIALVQQGCQHGHLS